MIDKQDQDTRRELEGTLGQGYSNTSEMRLNMLWDSESGQKV